MMYEEGEYSSLDTLSSEKEKEKKKKKKKENDHKRRFTDDQIKSLETIFESDTKLEPRKKLQVARELGLQPRQVAIWFQNKRARWKSKQLGRDYNILRSNYNNLASKFDTLKKEKQSLVVQLLGLRDRMEKSGKEVPTTDRKSGNNGESDLLSEHGVGILSDDFGLNDESDLLNMVEVELGDGSLTSTEDWDNLESNDDLLDQSSSSYYPWWDFWS